MTTLELQKALIAQGYKIQADGVMGPETQNALRQFQAKQFVTGEADKRTTEMLAKLAKEKPVQVPAITAIAKQILLPPSEYIQQDTPKGSITLHLTNGSGSPHFTRDTWRFDAFKWQQSIATHFIIAGDFQFPQNPAFNVKSGGVFQTIPLENWAYHVNFQKPCNQNNLGIEICNWGPVVKQGNQYIVPRLNVVLDESEVEEINFRDFQFWHRITDAQIEGLKTLLTALLDQYPEIREAIQTQKFDSSWADYNERIATGGQKGIFTHTNFIPEQARLRFDMPPFPRLLRMLQSLQ